MLRLTLQICMLHGECHRTQSLWMHTRPSEAEVDYSLRCPHIHVRFYSILRSLQAIYAYSDPGCLNIRVIINQHGNSLIFTIKVGPQVMSLNPKQYETINITGFVRTHPDPGTQTPAHWPNATHYMHFCTHTRVHALYLSIPSEIASRTTSGSSSTFISMNVYWNVTVQRLPVRA